MDEKGIMWNIFMKTGSIGAYLLYKYFDDIKRFIAEGEGDHLPAVNEEKGI
ncbi:MAG TPA: YqzL family protein [Clostridia bacterium]|nr:YqzL family protein [Clostridia bacterium]